MQPFDRQRNALTNYIQKEIVKQLLYRERPISVPGSRFRRISRLPMRRALVTSVLAGVLVTAVFWVTGWGAPLQLGADAEWWQRPTILTVIGLLAATGTFAAQVLLSNRMRIDKLGTAATSVSLTGEADGSYFDEYMDEIVYFFEMTGRDVVIIEDLDRFEDPSICASLRELNTLLNSSGQLRKRPVHFIYAVRDSIFEDLEDARRDPNGRVPDQTVDADPGVWQADSALSEPATQRTKFFELVIPIVPFITHRSSADLLSDLMREDRSGGFLRCDPCGRQACDRHAVAAEHRERVSGVPGADSGAGAPARPYPQRAVRCGGLQEHASAGLRADPCGRKRARHGLPAFTSRHHGGVVNTVGVAGRARGVRGSPYRDGRPCRAAGCSASEHGGAVALAHEPSHPQRLVRAGRPAVDTERGHDRRVLGAGDRLRSAHRGPRLHRSCVHPLRVDAA